MGARAVADGFSAAVTRGITAVVAVLAAALRSACTSEAIPSNLPEPLRDVFVDENTSVQAEATDVIEDNYYRSVTDARLRDASLRGMVRSLQQPLLALLHPARERAVPAGDERRVLGRRA